MHVHKEVKWANLVYLDCLVSTCISFSNLAAKKSTMNIERDSTISFLWKFEPDMLNMRHVCCFKNSNFTKNVWLISVFAIQQIYSFLQQILPQTLHEKR